MRFEGKAVWITGASSGIGEALAEAFAAEGAAVILSGRRRDALDAVAAGLGGESLVLPFESTDWAALPGAVETAWSWRGGVDILVNNAGISQRSLAIDTAPDVYRTIIEVDLLAPIWLTQLVLPRMAERGSGHLVAISSVAGRLGPVLRTAYAAAKHGLIGYCDSLRAEVESAYEIKVTTILPGSVRTEVVGQCAPCRRQPARRLGRQYRRRHGAGGMRAADPRRRRRGHARADRRRGRRSLRRGAAGAGSGKTVRHAQRRGRAAGRQAGGRRRGFSARSGPGQPPRSGP